MDKGVHLGSAIAMLNIISVVLSEVSQLEKTVRSFSEVVHGRSPVPITWVIKTPGKKYFKFPNITNVIFVFDFRADTSIYNAMNVALENIENGHVWFVNAGDTFNDQLLDIFKLDLKKSESHCFRINYLSHQTEELISIYEYMGSFIGHQAIIVPISEINKYGKFDEKYKIFSDQFLYKRIIENTSIIKHNSIPINMYDGGASDFHIPNLKEWIDVHQLHWGASHFNNLKIITKYLLKFTLNLLPYSLRLFIRRKNL